MLLITRHGPQHAAGSRIMFSILYLYLSCYITEHRETFTKKTLLKIVELAKSDLLSVKAGKH